jgi:hypothetical protein
MVLVNFNTVLFREELNGTNQHQHCTVREEWTGMDYNVLLGRSRMVHINSNTLLLEKSGMIHINFNTVLLEKNGMVHINFNTVMLEERVVHSNFNTLLFEKRMIWYPSTSTHAIRKESDMVYGVW